MFFVYYKNTYLGHTELYVFMVRVFCVLYVAVLIRRGMEFCVILSMSLLW